MGSGSIAGPENANPTQTGASALPENGSGIPKSRTAAEQAGKTGSGERSAVSEKGTDMPKDGNSERKDENRDPNDRGAGADRKERERVSRDRKSQDKNAEKRSRSGERLESHTEKPERSPNGSDSRTVKNRSEDGSGRAAMDRDVSDRKENHPKNAEDALESTSRERERVGGTYGENNRRGAHVHGKDASARFPDGRGPGREPRRRADGAAKSDAATPNRRSEAVGARHGKNPAAAKHGDGVSNKNPRSAEKSRFSLRWTWRDYALQLSVVVLGVVVTFAGSGLIDRWRQARQVRATMQLIVQELDYNRSQVAYVCEKLRYDRGGMRMFDRYGMDIDRIPRDSLERYMLVLGAMRSPALQTDALEVLKTSGVIQSVADKELLMKILGCYRELNSFADNVGLYNKRKLEAMDHFFAGGSATGYDASDPREVWRRMLADPLCESFIVSSADFFGNGDESYFDRVPARVADAAAAVRDTYGFAYDDTMH